MMMKLLHVGGMEVLTDNLRKADENNPRGYYEFERVKKLQDGDHEWLEQASGKAVKVISALLEYLPSTYSYKIIFMRRNMEEILSSQRRMLIRLGQPDGEVSDEQLAEMYQKHLERVSAWLAGQPHMQVLYVHYNELIAAPLPGLEQINRFLDGRMDIANMLPVIDKNLYRERKPVPSPGG